MNYALDALWWRLTDPDVRALASVLTAPALWQSGAELDVRTLLGGKGLRLLLALDARPDALHRHLRAHRPFGGRLGIYAESLLAYWLDNAPHTRLLGRNVAVYDANGRTAGAADFVALLDGEPCHIELACKYYGGRSGRPSEMAGLDPQDRLEEKTTKLERQRTLLQSGGARAVLRGLGLGAPPRAVSVVRGMAFFGQEQPAAAPLHPHCWHGRYIESWHEYGFSDGLKRYCLLPRLAFLAPARVKESETRTAAEIRTVESGLIAELAPRPDGCWHEVGRIMKAAAPEKTGAAAEG